MKVYKSIIYCVLSVFLSSKIQAQFISIDDAKNASELVNVLTNNSSCLQISNETVKGDTHTSGKNSYGSFTNTSSNFPFKSGIILSSGSSSNASGPFVRDFNDGNNSWLGDTDLNQTLNINSVNATVLEFDFIPLTNSISFNYLLASNEYQDNYPCEFSDGFAFLIKEKGSTNPYQNLAIIPGTTIPVSSFNIHPKIVFKDGCEAKNESYFSQLNTNPNNNSPINYAGQTKILHATSSVIPGKTYHIKLVVADDRFVYYDSAIFIEAASFNSEIDLGEDRLLASNNAICYGENYIIDTQLSPNYSYKWYKDGFLLPLETNPSYTVTSAGTYKVEVTLSPSTCVATKDIKIEYTPQIELKNSSLSLCDFDGNEKETFDLTQADTSIKNNNTTLSEITYYENILDAKNNNNPISNPLHYTNQTLTQTVIAKVTNSYNCAYYAELTLNVLKTDNQLPANIIIAVETTNFGGDNNTATIESISNGDFEFSIDGIFYQKSPEFTKLAPGDYIARARDKSLCTESVPFPFIILDYPRFFTPNGDGYNDHWTIKNLNTLPQATIRIFNRFGKFIKEFQSSNLNWNGTLNGYLLPADDYWFNLIFENGKSIKGHFSLKR